MDGAYEAGWYYHPQIGLIKIHESGDKGWVYVCYSESGQTALSREKPLDAWTWALCMPKDV